jgi:hypothetical protein
MNNPDTRLTRLPEAVTLQALQLMPLREVFSIVKIFTGQAQRRKFFTCKLAVKLKYFSL